MQITYSGCIMGVSAVSVRPIELDGTYPVKMPSAKILTGVKELPFEMQIETGERVVDKSDGVGVIAVHEEDDTLVGVDINLVMNELDINLIEMLVGSSGDEQTWSMPTIDQQRKDPKRFEMYVYAEIQKGVYVRHHFPYCRGTIKGLSYMLGEVSKPSIQIKARPNPQDMKCHNVGYAYELPS